VIVNPKTKKTLALMKRDGHFWDIPGGRTGRGEVIEKTLERELKEEILNLKDYKVVKLIYASKIKDSDNLLMIFYKVEADLEEVELSEEHESYRWISLEEVEALEKEAYIDPGIKEAFRLSLL
jgi:8-oxo-dGTP diphosphatase